MIGNTQLYEDTEEEEIIVPEVNIGPAEFAIAIRRLYSAEYSQSHDATWFRRMRRLHNEQMLVACYGSLN